MVIILYLLDVTEGTSEVVNSAILQYLMDIYKSWKK